MIKRNRVIECGNGNVGFEDDILELTKEQEEFKELLNDFEFEQVVEGSVYDGILIDKSKKYYTIDINNKSTVYVSRSGSEEIAMEGVRIGDSVSVYITNIIDKNEYTIYGSVYTIIMADITTKLEGYVKDRNILSGIPITMNHAGYTIETEIDNQMIYLFMPHLLTDVNKLPDPESILGTEINFIVNESNKDGQIQYIASRKAFMKTKIKKELKNLSVGDQCMGVITGATKFGVFVQFNTCLTALIHKSNLSEEGLAVFNRREVEPGMHIPFMIKTIDRRKEQIFGTQIIGESLWDDIKVGDVLTGTINDIKHFGLLVELDYETKGLIHKSNLQDLQYKIGDKVDVIVTNVSKTNRQVTLNFK